ncbi:MAG: protogloblin ApPgb [Deltaproteobacteria bacterium]|nr:protogloblin ApPgb [Deltaproteobacteria bacterium]
MTSIPGYTHGTSAVVRSPVSLEDFELMKKTALFGDEDVRYLRMSEAVLADQTDAILDVWYGFVGSQQHLLASFVDRDTKEPIGAYLGQVRARFGRWILDTARAQYDQAWLDYQHEIGLRHHRIKKNQTDGARASAIVQFRHLFPLVVPVTTTLVPFLAKKGHPSDEVEKMRAAWVKSCLLQVTLWSEPYVKSGDF